MSQRPAGTYVLSVVQVGAAGAQSAPGSDSWFWGGKLPTNPQNGPGPITNPTQKPPPGHKNSGKGKDGNPLDGLPASIRSKVERVKQEGGGTVSSLPHPDVHPSRVADDVVHAVQGVVQAVGSAGGGTGFPLLLVALVVMFLVAQNRIDRRDPKLALASIAADDMVEFGLPPSREDRP
jgi:hypothetical protein